MGATPKAADALVNWFLERAGTQNEAMQTQMDEQATANEATLAKEWGDPKAVEAISKSIVATFKKFGMTQEQIDWANDLGVFQEPALAIPLAKIAAQFADDPELGHHHTKTQEGVQDQLSEVTEQIKDFVREGKKVPDHLKSKKSELFAKLNIE
jgi:hypothetical protein